MSFATKKSMTRCLKCVIYNKMQSEDITSNPMWKKLQSYISGAFDQQIMKFGNKKDDIIILVQVFIHMASMINDKMMWMSKISFENVTT